MTVKYQIECSGSDVLVLEKNDGYHLTINSRVNPLSFGNKMAVYESVGKAIDAAEKFCRMYALTREYGYHLEESSFRKEGTEPIRVTELLDAEVSEDELREMLERTSKRLKAEKSG